MIRLQKRYEDDEVFRGRVDAIESFLGRNGFTRLTFAVPERWPVYAMR